MTDRPPATLRGPLAGVRVLDVADASAAYATKLLADLGADVIRIAPPSGDPLRLAEPRLDGPGAESLRYWFDNTNKRSVSLDLDSARGQASFEALVADADAIVETGTPGEMAARGLGYDHLASLRPELIVVSVTPFGQDGPHAGYVADDLITLAAGGLLSLGGYPDTAPIAVDGEQTTYAASLAAATALLIALLERAGTGRGCWIDVSAQECIAGALEDAIPEFDLRGTVRRRVGDRPREAGSGVYRCADGYVSMIAGRVGTAKAWGALVRWLREEGTLGADELAGPDWDSFKHRQTLESIETFGAVFARFAGRRTKAELYREAQARGIALSPVNRMDDVLADPQLNARDFFVSLRHHDLGRDVVYPGGPYRFSRTPWRLRSAAPRPGQHTAEVLGAASPARLPTRVV
jgi:benzylsuccinate CoA-transferase BbsE subunit